MTAGAPILPEAQRQAMRRSRKVQIVWLFVLATIVVAIYFSLGNSQAMKTAWIEDLLSFVPPLAFLVSGWLETRAPDDRFPFGLIRAVSIGYLVSAVALSGVGLFLIYDSIMALAGSEHPTIGTVEILGSTVWFGWVMIAALVYSVILPVIFGRLKLRPAHTLHDKILLADALMNKADWLTGVAAIVGILGIGMGWWWADAAAAIVISLDVLHDGFKHTGAAVRDLSDEMPRTLDDSDFDPLITEMLDRVEALDWVEDARLRVTQNGRFLTATVHVATDGDQALAERVEAAERALLALSWRIHDVSIVPRTRIERPAGGHSAAMRTSPLRAGAVRTAPRT